MSDTKVLIIGVVVSVMCLSMVLLKGCAIVYNPDYVKAEGQSYADKLGFYKALEKK